MKEAISWKGAWTLEDYIVDLFKKRQTDTPEFQTFLRILGREKLEKMWHKHIEKVKQQNAIPCRVHSGDCGC